MEKPLVSVIIPNYNNEKYLSECLDSVINQTYTNLEIIVVNDGSTDGSLKVINGYIGRDERIKCIDQKNSGAALARKHGLDAATGEWIQYLDSDDFLEPDSIEKLVTKAKETDADIVAAPFYFYQTDGSKKESNIYFFNEIDGVNYLQHLIERCDAYWSMCCHFQKRSLFYDSNVIIEPVTFGEDALFMCQILLYNPKVVSLKDFIFNYRENPMSVTHRAEYNAIRLKEMRFMRDRMIHYISQNGLMENFSLAIAKYRINIFQSLLYGHYTDFNKQELQDLKNDLKTFDALSSYYYRRALKLMRVFSFNIYFGKLLYRYYIIKKKY